MSKENSKDQDNESNIHVSDQPTSRLIVKGIPKHLTDGRLRAHFSSKGVVTDAKIMRKGTKSRLFGFVGFKTEKEAQEAKKFFNNSYIDTSKVVVDFAKPQNDPSIPRPWSKYSTGSSANKINKKDANGKVIASQDGKTGLSQEEIDQKKEKFREFLKVMGANKNNKQSWNDSFSNFMGHGEKLPIKSNLQSLKEKNKKKREEKEEEKQKDTQEEDKTQIETEDIDEQRLYVMNLPFSIQHEELQELFGKFGPIQEVEIPLRKGGEGTGYAFVRFENPESAISSYASLDKIYFQGRKLHILPAQKKPIKILPDFNFVNHDNDQEQDPEQPPNEEPQIQEEKPRERAKIDKDQKLSKYKQEKEKELKQNFDDEVNWNYLFMNQDSVATSMASKLNISKGSLLNRDQKNLAVRLAQSETIIINQTKQWLIENGINVDKFNTTDRLKCKRSKTVILVKNIPYTIKETELRDVFERYGVLKRLQISPFNTLAIVEYENEKQAKAAIKNLAYYKINYIMPIYLEFAPKFMAYDKMEGTKKQDVQAVEEEEEKSNIKEKEEQAQKDERTVFVKNLSFLTIEEQLELAFKESKVGKVQSVKIVKNDKQQSRGYGFVELDTKEAAEKAIKKLQNFILDDHALKLSLSQKKVTEAETKKKKDKLLGKRKEPTQEGIVENEEVKSNKLLVKNLAFESTKNDIRELFQSYGHIKNVRLPNKANSKQHRGFGFVEFVSQEEAKNAFLNLQDSHLYGRKVIIEWAKSDDSAFVNIESATTSNKKKKT